MCASRKSGSKRIAAGIMGIMMLVVVLFSACFIAFEADHDCEGDDCHICACIRQCEIILNQAGDVTVQAVEATAVVIFFISALFSVYRIAPETLVSQKVRLNN